MAKPYPSTTAITPGVLTNQLDTCPVQGIDDLHQTVDNTAYIPDTGFHSLNSRNRNSCHIGQGFLIDTKKGTRGAQLVCCYHVYIHVCI